MEPMPHIMILIFSALPVIGLGMLFVTLMSLLTNRDRWILPGTLVVLMLTAGWGAYLEYGDLLKGLFPKPPPEVVKAPPPEYVPPEIEPEPEPVARPKPARPKRDTRPRWVPVTDDRKDDSDRGGRMTVRVNPTPEQPKPARTEKPAPKPRTTTPKPAPIPKDLTPAPPPPKPTEVARVTPTPAPTPKPAPEPSRAGTGSLMVQIRGPVVETSSKPVRNPHILIILDQNRVEIIPPTRVEETRKDNNPNGEILAVTYFWENVTVAFNNLEPGWHIVMIDTSLDSPRSHQMSMVGSGQEQNDYNGTFEIKAGDNKIMEFSAKNFMTGQFLSPRIR